MCIRDRFHIVFKAVLIEHGGDLVGVRVEADVVHDQAELARDAAVAEQAQIAGKEDFFIRDAVAIGIFLAEGDHGVHKFINRSGHGQLQLVQPILADADGVGPRPAIDVENARHHTLQHPERTVRARARVDVYKRQPFVGAGAAGALRSARRTDGRRAGNRAANPAIVRKRGARGTRKRANSLLAKR